MKTSIRLKNYDYSSNGSYFITVCSYQKECIFGTIEKDSSLCRLTHIGKIIETEIELLKERYTGIIIENYIIMPNHIHLLIALNGQEQSPCPTISDVICTLKSKSAKAANALDGTKGRKIWQPRFYDHVVRNQEEYENIWNYIEYNIAKWNEDRFFIK